MQQITQAMQPGSITLPSKETRAWMDAAAKAEKQVEARRQLRDRLNHSRIPRAFEEADINKCPEEIKDWCLKALNKETRGLIIQGKVGRGKTYAACAAMLSLLPRIPCHFVTTDSLLREIRSTYDNDESEKDLFDRYCGRSLLCIDDFGKARMTEWSLPLVFEIIDTRWSYLRPTIITTQYGSDLVNRLSLPSDKDTAEAIVSRLNDYDRVILTGEDRRGK